MKAATDKLEMKLCGSIPENQHGDLNFIKFPPDNIPSNVKCKAVLSLQSTQKKGLESLLAPNSKK